MSIDLTKNHMLRHKTKSTLNNSAEFASKVSIIMIILYHYESITKYIS